MIRPRTYFLLVILSLFWAFQFGVVQAAESDQQRCDRLWTDGHYFLDLLTEDDSCDPTVPISQMPVQCQQWFSEFQARFNDFASFCAQRIDSGELQPPADYTSGQPLPTFSPSAPTPTPSDGGLFDVDWLPLVPCGVKGDPTRSAECNQCDLLKLLKNLIDMALFGITAPLATLFFVAAGFLYILSGANPGLASRARSIGTNTFFALLIIGGSWLIVNTLLRSFAKDNVAPEWWKITCTTTVQPTVTPPPTVDCENPSALAQKYNEPYPQKNASELETLMNCIQRQLPGQDLGGVFTYEESNKLCNYTRGQPICGTCAHAVNSCHYGGRSGSNGALAVDYGNEKLGNQIIQAANVCKAKSGARCENAKGQSVSCSDSSATHVHVNAGSCDSN